MLLLYHYYLFFTERSCNGHDRATGVNGDTAASTQDRATVCKTEGKGATIQEDASSACSYNSQHGVMDMHAVNSAELVHANSSSDDVCQQPAACAVSVADHSSVSGEHGQSLPFSDGFLNLLSNNQGRRIDDQRYSWPSAPCAAGSHGTGSSAAHEPAADHADGLDDAFLDLLMQCQVYSCDFLSWGNLSQSLHPG